MDTHNKDDRVPWSAEGHFELLSSEDGSKPCDSISPEKQDIEIPPWFDEDKFKRGQKFFYDNCFGMFVGKLCGLLAMLVVPSMLRIMMFTQRSSIPFTAYKRYVSTILHTSLWYQIDLTKDSRSWQSLMLVRKRHFCASQSACSRGLGNISQRDMALTQFGFLGFILVRSNKLGIQSSNRKDREAFVHVWRCIGYVLGIEDRFNICRESLEETEEICELIIQRILKPYLSAENKDYDNMTKALMEGMWAFNPLIVHPTFMYLTKRMCDLEDHKYPVMKCLENNNEDERQMTKLSTKIVDEMDSYARGLLWFMVYVSERYLSFYLIRMFLNANIRFALYCIRVFPFLAFYQFSGYKKCFVDMGLRKNSQKAA